MRDRGVIGGIQLCVGISIHISVFPMSQPLNKNYLCCTALPLNKANKEAIINFYNYEKIQFVGGNGGRTNKK